jgi:hypothetical protein
VTVSIGPVKFFFNELGTRTVCSRIKPSESVLKANSYSTLLILESVHLTCTSLTLLASTHAFRRDMASSRASFHLVLSLSLDAYNVYRLVSEEASEMINGYIDLESPKTALRSPLFSEPPSRRLSDAPMNGPRRRKSKGMG